MLNMKTSFGTYNVGFRVSRYCADNSVYIGAFSYEEGPIATLTTCLNDPTLDDDETYIDRNNCPWAEDFLINNGLALPTNIRRRSGYCVYPAVKLNMDKIMEHAIC